PWKVVNAEGDNETTGQQPRGEGGRCARRALTPPLYPPDSSIVAGGSSLGGPYRQASPSPARRQPSAESGADDIVKPQQLCELRDDVQGVVGADDVRRPVAGSLAVCSASQPLASSQA